MGDPWLVDAISTTGLAVALAACAGLRAWLPLLLAGALSRAGVLELGDSFRLLGSNKALALFALATVIEILGDKVPTVDHALDILSTFLRPAAGAVLAASVFGRITDPVQSVVLGIVVGAPSALVPHAAKAALRAASTTFTAGLANPVLSLLEDGATLVLFVLAVVVPLITAVALALAAVFLLRRLKPRRMATAVSP
jgi:Domain of unknown function (DUF4126)